MRSDGHARHADRATSRATTLLGLLTAATFGCATEPREPRLDHLEISITPAVAMLMVHDTARVRVQPLSQNGVLYPVLGVRVRSSDSTVVHVDAAGLVEARKLGTALIIAEVEDKADSLPLTVAGTLHTRPVTTSEVWTLADAPHGVRGQIAVGGPGGATLTLEAGVTVLFDSAAALTFGESAAGSLLAVGTPAAPILLRSTGAVTPGAWVGLTFFGPSAPELHSVTLRGCGAAREDGRPQSCLLVGHPFLSPNPTLLVEDVTIDSAGGTGMVLLRDSRFAPGSARLSVHAVGGHVATVPAALAAEFPVGGALSGNGADEIWLTGDTLTTSATWPDPGVPWVVSGPVLVEGPQAPVLTIPAGRTLRFAYGAGLEIGKNAPGGLAVGSHGGAPVTLTGADYSGWMGVEIWPGALPTSAIRGAALDGCGTTSDTFWGHACVYVIGDGAGAAPTVVLEDVTIRHASEAGVALVGGGRFGPGSANVVITETGGSFGAPITVYGTGVTSVPAGRYTGNKLDEIWIVGVDISADETWADRGIPYHLVGLAVENAADPLLTLEPGVVLVFEPGGILRVGGLAPGGVRAVGTAAQPVVFTGAYPWAASWMGVEIAEYADARTLFDHVTVRNAGGDDGHVAAAIRMAKDYGGIVRNTLISGSGGCGITRLGTGPWITDFTAPALGNTFQDNVGPPQCGP